MPSSLKENSDIQTNRYPDNGKTASKASSNTEHHRRALTAKPINVDEPSRFVGPARAGNPLQKRPLSRESSLSASTELKRPKLLETIPSDETDEDVDEPTDEDEDASNYASKLRTPTPHSEIHARRSISRRNALYPRPNRSDIASLDIDMPSTNNLSCIKDDQDDILEGMKYNYPKLRPPRYIPEFLTELEKNIKLSLDDFDDLPVQVHSPDDASSSNLQKSINLHYGTAG